MEVFAAQSFIDETGPGPEVRPTDNGKQWSKERIVDLEELDTEALILDADGAVSLDITKKKIVTIEFLP